jgi:2-polyprenyl-6-methoxyphenol hydroxylase-like FAD-dependent oxidoreductase
VADGNKITCIDMRVIEDEEDRMVILSLGTMIQIMYSHCIDLQRNKGLIDIRFNHRVTDVGQDATRRKAWAREGVGAAGKGPHLQRLEADYVVGCDGAKSVVRRSLFGRDWPGKTWDCRFIVQNVYYDRFDKHGWDGGNYMVDPDHWGLIARRGHRGLWRVTYGDPMPGLSDEKYLARRSSHLNGSRRLQN